MIRQNFNGLTFVITSVATTLTNLDKLIGDIFKKVLQRYGYKALGHLKKPTIEEEVLELNKIVDKLWKNWKNLELTLVRKNWLRG